MGPKIPIYTHIFSSGSSGLLRRNNGEIGKGRGREKNIHTVEIENNI
jgi:hypothetical protein